MPDSTKAPNERAQALLKALIETHIVEGQPVGSTKLAKSSGLSVSPATIRNVMKDLEALGYISAPHTSAGRVPTEAGYRLFIDTLIQTKPIEEQVMSQLREEIDREVDTNQILKSASSMLSNLTQLAGVVSLPYQKPASITKVDFVKLSQQRVLGVLVMMDGKVENRILQLEREYNHSELEQAGNYLTEHFAGMDIYSARTRLLDDLEVMKTSLNDLMTSVIDLGKEAFQSNKPQETLVTSGETHLMEYAELSDVEKLRKLFEAFNEKRDILHVLDRCADSDGVQIFIGHESGYDVMDDCSVVTAPYSADGEVLGVLGVIGPTRIAYDRIIPLVDVTAQILGSALKSD